WETETVPSNEKSQELHFIWIFGIDANPTGHEYKLFVNGNYCLTFSNPVTSSMKPWTVIGEGGASLLFRTTILDKYDDPMGYAVLTLPASMVTKGAPQKIRVTGESAGSRTWYMTFEARVEEKIQITQEEALVRGKKWNFIPILFEMVHLGEPVNAEISVNTQHTIKFTLEPGYNCQRYLLPELSDSCEFKAHFSIQGKDHFDRFFVAHPVKPQTIYLVQHTHTDIGYTRPQTEILPEHLRYIDYALDFCDQTDTLPDDARFRWTCETSWAVREYLKTRPEEQIERLRRRVREGRIEITGLFLNSSDLADESSIAASLQPVKEFRERGFAVRSAMQSDINGAPWCLTDYLSGAGIEFLNMAQNTHRARKPFDKPTAFWWESPSGNRILVNRPEHYMWGNNLGILTNMETFGKNLMQHLKDIRVQGCNYDHYAIQFSGYLTDNSPPSTTACSLVKKWNETYVWPRLRLATISEFPDYVRKYYTGDLPVVRGAWPDWWMDGFGSDAIATSYARKAHADNIANEGLMAFATITGRNPGPEILSLQQQINDDIAFYDEHTFGAAESITDPLAENSVVQLGEKEAYVWDAVKKIHILREEVMGLLQSGFQKADVPVITVFNTLNWYRDGLVTVYIDHQMLPRDKKFRILDWDNREIPVQPLSSREDGTYWTFLVNQVPPMGYKSLRIVVRNEVSEALAEPPFDGILENDFYKLTIDPAGGKITGLFDKVMKVELLEGKPEYPMASFIYERLGKNRSQLEMLRLEEFTRSVLQDIKISKITTGPVWKSVTLTGQMPGCADGDGIRSEIRLYNNLKMVEFRFSMKKLPVTDPEAVYVAFPFRLSGSHLVYETAGGTVVPGRDQIEGSSSDWNGIQNFVAIKNDTVQIVFVSPEIPLVQLGDINLGKFSRKADPKTTTIFSWVLNNYWTTNFLASQEGELKWNYQVTSLHDPSNLSASRFGWGNRVPLLSRVFPASVKPDSVFIPRSFFGGSMGDI
ncbi:MAG: glycoside hydrolase family 38 C-terminal domain-containing protein, partial [bacterium]